MTDTMKVPDGLIIPFTDRADHGLRYPVVFGYSGSEPALYCDADLRVLWAGRSVVEAFGLPDRLPEGTTCKDLFCGDGAECPDCGIHEVIAGGVPRTWDRELVDGRIFAVSAYPSFADGGSGGLDGSGLHGVFLFGTDVTENRRAQRQLQRTTDTVRSVFQAVPVGIGLVVDRVLTQVNEKLQEMTGYSADELLGQSVRLLYVADEEYEAVGAYKYRVLERDGVCGVETQFRTKDGGVIDVYMRSAVLDPEDPHAGVAFTVLDITDRKRTRQELEWALEQKNTLLREVHHRSKNNMQIISSLLNLESERAAAAGAGEASAPLQKMRARIRSMALVHEKLYQSDDLQRVDLAEYVDKLSADVVSLHGAALERSLEVESILVDIDFAIPFGLILNELLTNALQHGFDADVRGTVTISVSREQELVRLRICDDGCGVPTDFDIEQSSSLGLQLVAALVSQLQGSISVRGNGGTEWNIVLTDVAYLRGRTPGPGPRQNPAG
ncbi:MAG: sensor histidine kinase [Spirochaetaceae bacterium]